MTMILSLAFTLSAFASSGEAVMIIPAGTRAAEKPALPDDAALLITLEGTASGTDGKLSVYTSDESEGSWSLQFTSSASYGSAGLYKEAEGDMKTPAGIFSLNTPFGIKTPGEGFPDEYITLDDTLYWVGDPRSPLYNKLVSTSFYSDFDLAVSEHLIDYAGYYDYALDIGYNMEGTPGKGSAIFLHCTPDGAPTHGCIAIPEEYMARILRLYVKNRSYIAIYESGA